MEKNVNPVKRLLKCDHSIEESLLVNSAACENPCVLRTYDRQNVRSINGSARPLKENCRASLKCYFVSPARMRSR